MMLLLTGAAAQNILCELNAMCTTNRRWIDRVSDSNSICSGVPCDHNKTTGLEYMFFCKKEEEAEVCPYSYAMLLLPLKNRYWLRLLGMNCGCIWKKYRACWLTSTCMRTCPPHVMVTDLRYRRGGTAAAAVTAPAVVGAGGGRVPLLLLLFPSTLSASSKCTVMPTCL